MYFFRYSTLPTGALGVNFPKQPNHPRFDPCSQKTHGPNLSHYLSRCLPKSISYPVRSLTISKAMSDDKYKEDEVGDVEIDAGDSCGGYVSTWTTRDSWGVRFAIFSRVSWD